MALDLRIKMDKEISKSEVQIETKQKQGGEMKSFNICTKRTYEKDGVEKAVWNKVGTLREMDDGKKFLDLHMWPEGGFYVFPQDKKDWEGAS